MIRKIHDANGKETLKLVSTPDILIGFEGHTKERLVRFDDMSLFIYRCLDTKNLQYDLDDLAYYIDSHKL